MNPYTRAALFLIRLTASGFILFPLLQMAGYFAVYLKSDKKPDLSTLSIVVLSLSLLIGLILLAKAGAIAKRVTKDFDE